MGQEHESGLVNHGETEARHRSSASPNDSPFRVVLRCRPETDGERCRHPLGCGSSSAIRAASDLSVTLMDKVYHLDGVSFAEDEPLPVFYSRFIAALVRDVMAGADRSVVVYGPTGSGKSHTMFHNGQGIAHLALEQLFSGEEPIRVRMSCLEVHNERVLDLLAGNQARCSSNSSGLRILHGRAMGALSFTSSCLESLLKQVAPAVHRRRVAPTQLNAQSSRSHCILSFEVESTGGRISFIDLAGSESVGRSGAVDENAKQAGNINHGLLVLRRVMEALFRKSPRIPFRDSKLTQLLQPSLLVKAKDSSASPTTLLILCASPNPLQAHETMVTLQYGTMARNIEALSFSDVLNVKGLKNLPDREWIEEKLREKDNLIHRLREQNLQLSSRLNAIERSLVSNKEYDHGISRDCWKAVDSFSGFNQPFSKSSLSGDSDESISSSSNDLQGKFSKFTRESAVGELSQSKISTPSSSSEAFHDENWLFDPTYSMCDLNKAGCEWSDSERSDSCPSRRDSIQYGTLDEDFVDAWMRSYTCEAG